MRDRPQRPRRRPRASLGGAAAAMAWGYAWRQMVRHSRQQETMVAAAERESERPMTAYEVSDWNVGSVGLIYLGAFVLLVLSCLVLIAAYPASVHDVDRTVHIAPPGPRLQTNPGGDLKNFRAEEQKQLDTYYWIDRHKGLVHIPIAEAIKRLVQTGIPGFPQAQP
jgi:hypothetical protein